MAVLMGWASGMKDAMDDLKLGRNHLVCKDSHATSIPGMSRVRNDPVVVLGEKQGSAIIESHRDFKRQFLP